MIFGVSLDSLYSITYMESGMDSSTKHGENNFKKLLVVQQSAVSFARLRSIPERKGDEQPLLKFNDLLEVRDLNPSFS
ncbi:hypothetical protein [Okeania sp. SIO1I7]|uniref:hypothetical protein n=1 Tax=Okeania sp. SIO1I7 TaxID=2607772 RepID=UPI0013F9B370|nr:hypothetical protein [Okeania sp. SIO1I7]NET23982.1 hypothetical protein [Okeania sp. SIO1I7]